MKILITGSSGQIGSYLFEYLYNKNHEVIGFDVRDSAIASIQEHTIKGNILDYEIVNKTIKSEAPDAILHLAAQVSVEASLNDPVFDAETNITGTLNLLKSAYEANISHFIYFSSAAVFGNPKYCPIDEKHPLDPISPYGISKLGAERYCLMFNKIYKLPVTIIKPFNIYSARQDPKSPYSGVITKFINAAKNNKSLTIFGDGGQTRDFIHVNDVVKFTELILLSNRSNGEIFNCGTGMPTTMNKLAETIIDLSGKKLEIQHAPPQNDDIINSYADISKAKKILNFNPEVSLRAGLEKLLS